MEQLYSNLCHFLTVALIFLGDIFARECKSEECYPESEESNPKISINHEFWRWTCCSKIRERNLTRNILNHWSYCFLCIGLDEEEGDDHHSDTESKYSPFPYLSAKKSWIENPTNEPHKRKEVENIDEIRRNDVIIPRRFLNSESNHKNQYNCKNNTYNADVFIRRFCLNSFDKFEHSWKIMNAKWV